MAPTCRICGRGLGQIGGYLQRVNEKGVPGVWECSPACDADPPTETVLLMAVENNGDLLPQTPRGEVKP